MTNAQEMVHLSLELPSELNEIVEELASKMGGTKSDVLHQAIALMQTIVKAKEQGKAFGIENLDRPLATEIIIPSPGKPIGTPLENFLETFGSWEDDRTTEEIIKDIYDSRSISESEYIL